MNNYFRRLIFNLFIFTIFPALLFSACAEKPQAAGEQPRGVRGVLAGLREIPEETGGFGSLSFLTKVDIAAPQDGRIKQLYFREGDTVERGAALVLLDNSQITLAVERAENNYSQAKAACDLARSRLLEGEFQAEAQLLAIEKAEAELSQAKKKWKEDQRKHLNQEALFQAGGIHAEAILTSRFSIQSEWEQILIMEKDLEIRRIGCRDSDLAAAGRLIPPDAAERRRALVSLITASLGAELGAALARLEASEKELSSARIAQEELLVRSPASGVIGARYFEEGERVKAEDKILTLMDTASLYAIFPLREKEALRLERGMSALVRIDGTGESREGRVDLIYPQADSQSMSFLVRVLLLDGGTGMGDLKPGMFVRVQVSIGPPRRAIIIPESSIVSKRNSEGIVFVINGNVLSERKISLGTALGDEREITAGLGAGELVVLRPDADLREGSYVSLAD
ncbi:MAG: efflux RND transporter periplasmic adaptor subunit [Treponema sp.]|jgi:RND family efflux transporter MFP subunit|nr:efflux RND transporter periplasmic adaptor subunit [Treponema sp.]